MRKLTPYPKSPFNLNLDVRHEDFIPDFEEAMDYGPALVKHQVDNNYRWVIATPNLSVIFIWDINTQKWIQPQIDKLDTINTMLTECGCTEHTVANDGIVKRRQYFDRSKYFYEQTGYNRFNPPVTDQGNFL